MPPFLPGHSHFLRVPAMKYLIAACCVLAAVMLAATLYPFQFYPRNGVRWLSGQPGLYFDGHGIAWADYTPADTNNPGIPALSIELWLHEHGDSRNFGPREIVTVYNGSPSVPLVLGMWSGRLFAYSCFVHPHNADEWFRDFLVKTPLQRGVTHFVTLVYGADQQTIFVDGEELETRHMALGSEMQSDFSGRLIVGNSFVGDHGWMGEIHGVAVYDRLLSASEVDRHFRLSRRRGMEALSHQSGLLALYPLAGCGSVGTENIVGNFSPMIIPSRRSIDIAPFCHLPAADLKKPLDWVGDFLGNILFFMPLGFLLLAAISHRRESTSGMHWFIVAAVCAVFSLGIESVQLIIPARIASIADVVSNTLGGFFGAIAARFCTSAGVLPGLCRRTVTG